MISVLSIDGQDDSAIRGRHDQEKLDSFLFFYFHDTTYMQLILKESIMRALR